MLKQSLQQKLGLKINPLQIQLIKLLELPTYQLEQRIKEELEQLTNFKIDIVNFRENLSDSFKKNILKDAIYI